MDELHEYIDILSRQAERVSRMQGSIAKEVRAAPARRPPSPSYASAMASECVCACVQKVNTLVEMAKNLKTKHSRTSVDGEALGDCLRQLADLTGVQLSGKKRRMSAASSSGYALQAGTPDRNEPEDDVEDCDGEFEAGEEGGCTEEVSMVGQPAKEKVVDMKSIPDALIESMCLDTSETDLKKVTRMVNVYITSKSLSQEKRPGEAVKVRCDKNLSRLLGMKENALFNRLNLSLKIHSKYGAPIPLHI